MAEANDARVAVYLDFDNIVISWYDRVHGRNAYGKDRQRISENPDDPDACNPYQELQFPDEVYESIQEYREKRQTS